MTYQSAITRIARETFGLTAPVSFLAAQIEQESGWRPALTSRAGARGLAQFMPATADWIEDQHPMLARLARTSVEWSLRAQSLYMRHLLSQITVFDNECERWAFAASAYNGGLRWTHERQARSLKPGICLGLTCRINPGILASNQRENERYSERIADLLEPRYVRARYGRGACWLPSEVN